MNPVREALYQALIGDAAITALLSDETAVYYRRAPRDAEPPFVVFSEQVPGLDVWTFDGPSMIDETWLVKGVDRSPSASVAEEIEQAIADLLNDATLPLSEGLLLSIRRRSRVSYPEDDGAEIWHHQGGLFRLQVQTA